MHFAKTYQINEKLYFVLFVKMYFLQSATNFKHELYAIHSATRYIQEYIQNIYESKYLINALNLVIIVSGLPGNLEMKVTHL